MTPMTAHQVTVVGPADGMYYLGYYAPGDAKFFVIQPFFSADLARATSNLMNRARELAQYDEASHGR